MNQMTDALVPVLRSAANAILDIYRDADRFNTEYKQDNSPLTEADKRSNRILCDALADLFPGIPVISEENKQAAYAERQKFKSFFLVDPLDGTKEFIKRNDEFTINVAYVEGEYPVCGYVYVPVSGQCYIGEKRSGAWRKDSEDRVTPLQSLSFSLRSRGIKIVASRSHRDPLTEKIISRLNHPEIVSVGSALKFVRIAEGAAHFYPRLAPTMEWDTAAAQCVLEEAGGGVVRFDTLRPVYYNKEDLLSPYFIAFGKLLDPEYLEEIVRDLK